MSITPLHVAMVNGHPVRLYRSPWSEVEFPWHAMPDLFAALDFSEAEAAPAIEWFAENWPGHTLMADAVGGEVAIASDQLARGVFAWLLDCYQGDRPLASWAAEFEAALSLAFLVQNLDLPVEEAVRRAQLAALRSCGAAGRG